MSVDFYFDTSDFRDVEGVKLPFKFEQVVTYPIITQKRVGTLSGMIVEYRHNVTIDPKMFKERLRIIGLSESARLRLNSIAKMLPTSFVEKKAAVSGSLY
jgi:hypothetical protein